MITASRYRYSDANPTVLAVNISDANPTVLSVNITATQSSVYEGVLYHCFSLLSMYIVLQGHSEKVVSTDLEKEICSL